MAFVTKTFDKRIYIGYCGKTMQGAIVAIKNRNASAIPTSRIAKQNMGTSCRQQSALTEMHVPPQSITIAQLHLMPLTKQAKHGRQEQKVSPIRQ